MSDSGSMNSSPSASPRFKLPVAGNVVEDLQKDLPAVSDYEMVDPPPPTQLPLSLPEDDDEEIMKREQEPVHVDASVSPGTGPTLRSPPLPSPSRDPTPSIQKDLSGADIFLDESFRIEANEAADKASAEIEASSADLPHSAEETPAQPSNEDLRLEVMKLREKEAARLREKEEAKAMRKAERKKKKAEEKRAQKAAAKAAAEQAAEEKKAAAEKEKKRKEEEEAERRKKEEDENIRKEWAQLQKEKAELSARQQQALESEESDEEDSSSEQSEEEEEQDGMAKQGVVSDDENQVSDGGKRNSEGKGDGGDEGSEEPGVSGENSEEVSDGKDAPMEVDEEGNEDEDEDEPEDEDGGEDAEPEEVDTTQVLTRMASTASYLAHIGSIMRTHINLGAFLPGAEPARYPSRVALGIASNSLFADTPDLVNNENLQLAVRQIADMAIHMRSQHD
jgi:hypothetical protein